MEPDPAIMRGSGQGLLEFCDRLAARGDIDPDRAKAYRTSAKKILEVESATLDEINLRELDVDELFARFTKLNKAVYSDGSLKTYRSRLKQAVGMYLAWLDDDPAWKTGGRPAPKTAANGSVGSARKTTSRRPKTPTAQPENENAEVTDEKVLPMMSSSGTQLITYDVPLRHDLIIRMTLPIDLTEADADRLTAFVRSLAFSRRSGKPETHQVEGDARDADAL
jgi:hypothetical protein